MVWSVFPNDPKISFELHLFGAISGIMMALLLRNRDEIVVRKIYSWENENAQEEVLDYDYIGDEWKMLDDSDGFESKPETDI